MLIVWRSAHRQFFFTIQRLTVKRVKSRTAPFFIVWRGTHQGIFFLPTIASVELRCSNLCRKCSIFIVWRGTHQGFFFHPTIAMTQKMTQKIEVALCFLVKIASSLRKRPTMLIVGRKNNPWCKKSYPPPDNGGASRFFSQREPFEFFIFHKEK